jgi:hypothetical protein
MTARAEIKAQSIQKTLRKTYPSLTIDVYVDDHSLVVFASNDSHRFTEYCGDGELNADIVRLYTPELVKLDAEQSAA